MAHRPLLSPADTTLSRAQGRDLDDILAIEARAFPTPWSRAAFSHYLGEHGFIVCHAREALVGYILVGLQPPSLLDRLERITLGLFGSRGGEEAVGHVMNLAVRGDHRGLGLGRHLLLAGLLHLQGLGVARVQLEVRVDNHPAIRLYESAGFSTQKLLRAYYQNGDDAFLMEAPLA